MDRVAGGGVWLWSLTSQLLMCRLCSHLLNKGRGFAEWAGLVVLRMLACAVHGDVPTQGGSHSMLVYSQGDSQGDSHLMLVYSQHQQQQTTSFPLFMLRLGNAGLSVHLIKLDTTMCCH